MSMAVTEAIAWRDEYNIGVEIVDKAHQQLMMVVKRLLNLTKGGVKGEFAYGEGIQYLKNYTLKHFAEEEAYMKSINFSNFEAHKVIHDTLRDKTIPDLQMKMELWDYSQEMVEEFLGIYIGWLGCHIMLQDQTINGKIPVKSPPPSGETTIGTLERILPRIISEVFYIPAEVVRDRYIGDHLGDEKIYHYKLIYTSGEKTVRVCFSMEDRMVQIAIKTLLVFDHEIPDLMLRTIIKMFGPTVVQRIGVYMPPTEEKYELQSCTAISNDKAIELYDESRKLFQKEDHGYNVLIETHIGQLAISIAECGAE